MSSPDLPPKPISPQDNLPEVRPPTAGFIIQLFVIPALVVLLIVLVWLAFTWLAHIGGSPASYVAEMKKNKANSWQQANNLAEELTHNEAARNDAALAKDLADFLNTLLDQPLPEVTEPKEHERNLRTEEVQRRGFVCRALGEFRVPDDALPALLRAAGPTVLVIGGKVEPNEVQVRLAALQAVALLADNVRQPERALSHPRLLPTLLAATRDDDRIIATTATYTLGVLGGDEAIKRLTQILREARPADVHYNAAIGLARHDNAAGVAVIAEMIDPSSTRGLVGEEVGEQQIKRQTMQMNGLRAARQLAARNKTADLSALIDPIKKLQASEAPQMIQAEAAMALAELQKRPAGGK